MPDTDDQQATTTPEGSVDAPPAGDAGATPPASETRADDDATTSADDARVAALSKEAAAYRRKLRELEAKVAEHERAQLSEADRLRAEAEDARNALEAERAERARERTQTLVIAAAAKQNAVDPEAVWALTRDEATAAGDDLDVEKLVKQTLKQRPYLVRHPATGGEADPARSSGGPRPETDAERRARMRGTSASEVMFDAQRNRDRGGGVVFRGTE